MSLKEHEILKEELRKREISEDELRKHESSVDDRSFTAFLIGIIVFLLFGLAMGASIALKYCGCSWASFWKSFLNSF